MAIFENLKQKLTASLKENGQTSYENRVEYIDKSKEKIQQVIEDYVKTSCMPVPATAKQLTIKVTHLLLSNDGWLYVAIESKYDTINTKKSTDMKLFEFSGFFCYDDNTNNVISNWHQVIDGDTAFLWDPEHPEFQQIYITELFDDCFMMTIDLSE